jgi:hypothetical protein
VKISIYKDLLGKPAGNRPVLRPRSRQQNNKKVDLKYVGRYGLDAHGSGQEELAGSCQHSKESSVSAKCWDCSNKCNKGTLAEILLPL